VAHRLRFLEQAVKVVVEQPVYELTPEEEADLEASLAEAARGEFATDEEVAAMWARRPL
jgi:predicted transcriptional regulator